MLDWDKYSQIADCFQHKARHEDREDLRQDIIIRLADVASNNGHKPFTEGAMVRVASYTVMAYWRDLMRKPTILSLNYEIEDGDGDSIELVENMVSLREGREPTGTDAEATAYLYAASLTAPMDEDWTKIYLYVAGKTYARANRGGELPEDIRVESLNDDQMANLHRLKEWIYRKRTEARWEGERAERRQKKEEVRARIEAAQPALFRF